MIREARPQTDKILKPQIPQITHKNLTVCEDKSQLKIFIRNVII